MACSTVLILALVTVGVYKLTKLRQEYYQTIKYDYPINLAQRKNFMTIVGGSFMAGILQGTLGMGSGHTISLALLAIGSLPEVVSGTSGFIVAYITLATLIQELTMKDASIQEAGFLFGIVFSISLVGTFLLTKFLKKKYDISKAILLILGGLCILSIVGTLASIGL